MREIGVYIPTGVSVIDKGSGIVGREYPAIDGRLEVYYEGNRFGAMNIVTFADRVYHAANRMETAYPTVARGVYGLAEFEHVGTFAEDRVQLDASGLTLTRLAKWIGAGKWDGEFFVPDGPRLDAELRRSGR